MITRTIAATTHGRYLIDVPAASGPAPLIVGFHGYAEAAETQLENEREALRRLQERLRRVRADPRDAEQRNRVVRDIRVDRADEARLKRKLIICRACLAGESARDDATH